MERDARQVSVVSLIATILARAACALACALAVGIPAHAADYKPELDQPGRDVIWVPTPEALAHVMLDLAKVTAGDYLIDLGSGDGRLVILAAKRGAQALGIEYNPKLVAYAQTAAKKAGVADKARFIKADLFTADVSRATVVTLFLGPDLNKKLLPKLLALKPGTRIVANTHTIGDWPADAVAQSTDDEKSVYYRIARLWIVPAKVDGAWRMLQGPLRIAQRYQQLEGTLQTQGKAVPVRGQVQADRVSFTAAGVRYEGVVKGNFIEGTRTQDGNSAPWRAIRER